MRTLYLLRHAKSSRDDPELDDFDRPLAPRGRRAARRMGAWMRAQAIRPDLVLCSAALRARQTWRLAAGEFDRPVPEKVMRSLYAAPPTRMLAALRRVPDAAASVLLVGHNPGLEHLAARLAGPESDADALDRMRRKFPTAALAILEFPQESWPAAAAGQGRLVGFLRPKDLGG